MISFKCKLILYIYFCVIFTTNVNLIKLNNKKFKQISNNKHNLGFIKINVDSMLTYVKVNDIQLDLSAFKNRFVYDVYDIVKYDFEEGDIIKIGVKNYGDYSIENNGYLIAEIYYHDSEFNNLVIASDSQWFCDGEPAFDLGKYGEVDFISESPSSDYVDGFVYAHYIWSKDFTKTDIACSVILGSKKDYIEKIENNSDESNNLKDAIKSSSNNLYTLRKESTENNEKVNYVEHPDIEYKISNINTNNCLD